MTRAQDLINKQFGYLTVVRKTERRSSRGGSIIWECTCICGNTSYRAAAELNSGQYRSCGCKRAERQIKTAPGQMGFNRLKKNYRRAAKDRGYVFDISDDALQILTKQNCYYCNQPPENSCISGERVLSERRLEHNKYAYNGVDRLDNSRGYTTDNVVPCCKMCNLAKHNNSAIKFIEWINRTAEHINKMGLNEKVKLKLNQGEIL